MNKLTYLFFVSIGLLVILFLFLIVKNSLTILNKFEDTYQNDYTGDTVILKTFYDLNSSKIDTIDFNHPCIVNFWTYYCKPCLEEFPILESIALQNNLKLYYFTNDTSELTKNTFKLHLKNQKCYIYMDSTSLGQTKVFPRTIFIRNNKIVTDLSGSLKLHDKYLDKYVQKILK